MPKYRVIERGKSVMCAECGTIYSGANHRNLAIRCYETHHKPPESPSFTPYDIQPKDAGAGVDFPDTHGHFRRISPQNPDYNRVQLGKARYRNEHQQDIDAWLSAAIKRMESWPETVTPLQRLSYAFQMRRWESVKQAAIALGYTVAVRMRVEALNIPEIIRRELHLDRVVTEYLMTEDDVDREQGKRDVNKLADRLRLDDMLNDILGGEDD